MFFCSYLTEEEIDNQSDTEREGGFQWNLESTQSSQRLSKEFQVNQNIQSMRERELVALLHVSFH
jgi:hypothetical protein